MSLRSLWRLVWCRPEPTRVDALRALLETPCE
jgi:hypothetical protein